MEGVLVLDMIVDGRWILHQFLIDIARLSYRYCATPARIRRATVTTGDLSYLSPCDTFVSLYFSLRLLRAKPGALLAASGALLSLITWCLEVVSLHQIDAVSIVRFGGVWLSVLYG